MAKFNIQVELDWFGEDSEANIDDELKAAIMSQIVSKTVDKLTANLQEEANELMTKKLEEFTLTLVRTLAKRKLSAKLLLAPSISNNLKLY